MNQASSTRPKPSASARPSARSTTNPRTTPNASLTTVRTGCCSLRRPAPGPWPRPDIPRSSSTTGKRLGGSTRLNSHPLRHRYRRSSGNILNAKAAAAWSASCLVIVLVTSNPAYKSAVLAAAFTTLAATAGLGRMHRLLVGVALIAGFDVLLNFVSAHLGQRVLLVLAYSFLVGGVG